MYLADLVDALHVDGEGFAVEVPDSWTQGRTVFGGLSAALLVRVMRRVSGIDWPLRSLQTTFIGPVPPGALHLTARKLRTGKSAVHVEAQIVDQGQVLCAALGVFGLARSSVVRLDPPPIQAARDPASSPQIPYVPGLSPPFTQFVDQRWSSGGFPFCAANEARTQIWIRYPKEPRVDESLVVALGDSIPSPALSLLKRPAPASSLSWTFEWLSHDLPHDASDWWLMDAQATHAGDGYVFQTAMLHDARGRAIALSRQSAVVFG